MKRAAAWFCVLGGTLLNIELLLTSGRVNFVWLLLLALSAGWLQRNGWTAAAQHEE
jgi:hypothetical protein